MPCLQRAVNPREVAGKAATQGQNRVESALGVLWVRDGKLGHSPGVRNP